MKRLSTLLAVFLTFLLSFNAFSYSPKLPEAAVAKKAIIEKNLIKGLETGNEGVMLDAAYYLGEYKCEGGVIPLMKILNNNDNDGIRIMAALALAKIGTGKSLYAVKQNIFFDDSESVRKFCLQFYTAAKEKRQSYTEQ
ncbi:MAG: HEAT repeat domain-containing protein [Ignavibacteriaceae bacterium]